MTTRGLTHLAGAAAALVVLAACGSTDQDASNSGALSSTPPPVSDSSIPHSTPPPVPGAPATVVDVTETEFHLDLSASSAPAGTVRFVVHNAGDITHALSVDTPAGTKSTDDIAPGDTTTLTVDLDTGSVEVWCPVGDHKDEGMDTHLTVS